MEYAVGGLVVLAVLAFVLLPLIGTRSSEVLRPLSPSSAEERAAVYRELLELELDRKVGKIAEPEFQEQSDALLARAATLIAGEDAQVAADDEALEREIAETRRSLRPAESSPAGEGVG